MANQTDRWKRFWEGQTTPLHGADTADFYAQLAEEARLLIDRRPFGSVLEIGCGSGALYPHLGFASARYRGVDLSSTMLAAFTRHSPGVDVVCGSGHDYVEDQAYDLIFSLGVLQYFSAAMFDHHMQLAARMLTPGGRVVHMHVPMRALLVAHAMGWLSPGGRNPLMGALAAIRYLLPHPMGRWYGVRATMRTARRHGFRGEFFGSVLYPYRGSFVFTRM